MGRVRQEREKKGLFTHTVVNDSIDRAYDELRSIITDKEATMARITVEDCMDNVENRFELVHLAAKRSKQLIKGARPLVRSTNREIVTSLREIAAGKVYFEKKRSGREEIPYQLSNFAP